MRDDEWTKLNKKARTSILLNLTDDVLYHVMKEKTAAETMAKLEKIYAKKSLENRMYVLMQLFTLRMAEGTEVEDHLRTFNRLVCKLVEIDEPMKDEYQACILLNSLPDSYKSFRDSVCAGRETINAETIISVLQSKAMRKKSGDVASRYSSEALVMRGRSSEHGRYSKSGSMTKGKGKAKVKC